MRVRSYVLFSLALLNLTFVICHWSFAQDQYLRDVPEGHYAYDAVNDLVRRGVTNGFPDGTYRGKKEMNRFEIAAFISKLARSLNRQRATGEKMVAELRTEVATLAYVQAERSRETGVAVELLYRGREAEAPGKRGALADYRLRTVVTKRFSELADLRLTLDTMDSGYGGGDRDLVRDLLDFTGTVKLGPGTLQIASGPGDVTHTDSGYFPGENGVKYRRPRRSLAYALRWHGTDLALTEQVRSTDQSGVIGVRELSLKISRPISGWQAGVNPRLFSANDGRQDNRLDLSLAAEPWPGLTGDVLLGVAKMADYPHGLYLRGELSYGDLVRLVAQRLGSQYRETFSYSIFDVFDRNLSDGATSIGIIVSAGNDWFFRAKGDLTAPGDALTTEWRIGRKLTPQYSLQLSYQTYKSASVTLSQALGLEARICF